MIFFNKRKKVVVDCFTYHAGIHNYYPIDRSIKFTEDWWKNLSSTYESQNQVGMTEKRGTLKRCMGVIELYKNAWTLPLWHDVDFEVDEAGYYRYNCATTNSSTMISHDHKQYGANFEKYIHVKMTSPWLFKEKRGINFYWTDPFWTRTKFLDKWQVIPGTLNWKYQTTTNINIFLPRVTQRIEIPAGTPMVSIIPMTEHDVEFKCHEVSEQEYLRIQNQTSYVSKFVNSYANNKKLAQKKESKCPFGFGK
jgi:hypothetical protein